jgi:succinyl-diaminopimelate desuccinylase
VHEAAGEDVAVTVTDHAPAGRPERGNPFVAAFTAATGAAVGPKQAWTDVGRLSDAGVPALNFGPGLTAQAHQAGEYVPVANLTAGRDGLARALAALPTR